MVGILTSQNLLPVFLFEKFECESFDFLLCAVVSRVKRFLKRQFYKTEILSHLAKSNS